MKNGTAKPNPEFRVSAGLNDLEKKALDYIAGCEEREPSWVVRAAIRAFFRMYVTDNAKSREMSQQLSAGEASMGYAGKSAAVDSAAK